MNTIENILSDLIAIRTDDKTKSNRNFVEYVCKILSENNILFKKIPNASGIQESIIAGINIQEFKNINTGLVLSGHMDTVSTNPKDWDTNPFQAHNINGNIYGLGAVDMKYFIAVILSMLSKLKETKIPIFLLFSCDEETDVTGIQSLLSFLDIRNIQPKYALVGEPSQFNLCVSNKGYVGYTTIVKGVSAHSSRPDLGTNAAYIAAKIVSAIEELNKKYDPKEITLNVGVLSGGEGRNSIPSEVSIDWEIRYTKEATKNEILRQVQDLHKRISEEYKNSHILLEIKEFLPPFEKVENSKITKIAEGILGTSAFAMPHATEAGFLQSYGIETLICGAGDEKLAHSAFERINANDLLRYRDFLINFVQKIQQDLSL